MSAIAVFHIPHGATAIPADVRRRLLLSDEQLAQELLRVTTPHTEELFAHRDEDAVALRFPVSRSSSIRSATWTTPRSPWRRAGWESSTRALRWGDAAGPPLFERTRRSHQPLLRAPPGGGGGCGRLGPGPARPLARGDCHSFPSRPLPCDLDQAPDRPRCAWAPTGSTRPPGPSAWPNTCLSLPGSR